MLMKPAVSSAIDHVTLRENATAAFIKVNAPAPVTCGCHVMPEVVYDPRPRLFAQRVDASHVAKHGTVAIRFHTDMVDMVELDRVIRSQGRTITPGPANRDAGVKEIVNLAVDDTVVRRLTNPDTYRAVEEFASVSDAALADLVASSLFFRLLANRSFANLNTAAAEIGKR